MSIKRIAVCALVITACAAQALAAEWSRYGNARFKYFIDIPPGFSAVREAENGDGGVSQSADGRATLRVWGHYLLEGSIREEATSRADDERADGWTVSYQQQGEGWAVWSGTKGSRIFYARAVPVCDGAAAYFRLEYDKNRAAAFDPVIVRLGKSLRSGRC